jgi:acyl-coenzyme A synthetase/AMP-(fatty) acid ligase/thioesterase domain-containing protein/acyl carrier protein
MRDQSKRDPGREQERVETISGRFKEIVIRYARQVAVKSARQAITYEELNRLSARLGKCILHKLGAAPRPIALLLEDGADTIAALLGVIRAGHFYCALSQKDSPSRLLDVLQDLGPGLLVTDSQSLSLAGQVVPPGCEVLLLSDIQDTDEVCLTSVLDPETLLGIFYTSGSTGDPKGVLRTHSYVLHRMRVDVQDYAINSDDRLLYMRQFNVSSSLSSIFDALLTGATLVIYDVETLGIASLANLLISEQITIFPPPIELLRHFLDLLEAGIRFPSIRCVILGGDVLFRRDVERIRSHLPTHALVIHHLSSSESGLLARSILKHDSPLVSDIVPLGFPVSGKEVIILDQQTGQILQSGRPGEIAVRSKVIFPGYWRQPELSEQKFRPDPMDPTGRIFCTGDLGYFRHDGQLVFLGRDDFRVKIRGFSIDLASIESVLMSDAEVKRAVVTPQVDSLGQKRLVAYVVLATDSDHTPATLRAFMLKSLPEFMVPSVFVFLPELPMTASLKVDRKALPKPDWSQVQASVPYAAPQDEVESKIATLWQEVLGVEKAGIDDRFFDSGGDSLMAISIFLEIEKTFDIRLPLRTMIDHQSIRELAPLIRNPEQIHQEMVVELSTSGSGLQVFLIPGGGGEILGMLPLAQLLEGKQPVYGLQAAGVDGKHLYKQTVEEIATQFIRAVRSVQPSGPYRLIGGSFGGVVAYEMARLLTAAGEYVELLGMIDTLPPGPRRKASLLARLRIHWQKLRSLSIMRYPSYLLNWWKIFLVGLARQKYFRKLFTFKSLDSAIQGTDIVRAGRTAYTLYEPKPYSGKVVIFKAKDRPWYVNWDTMEGWRKNILGEMIVVDVEGTHGLVYKHPYVEGLAKAISAHL